jgi:curved DNA-binding protein CbpA
LGAVGLGGLFLKIPNPLALGSTVELLFDVANGNEVRARAIVRNVKPGKGMGVKFVHMGPEDRSRLNQFLKTQLESGNIQGGANGKVIADASTEAAAHARTVPSVAPPPRSSGTAGELAIRGSGAPVEHPVSEEELKLYVAMAEKNNYYQLLGVAADSSKDQIKQSFYALARKFHPDHHMGKAEWAELLQQLMGAANQAYNVLSDDQRRAAYDERRALSEGRTVADETIEESLQLAAACRRDKNFAGSVVWMRKCVVLAPDVAKYRVLLAVSLTAEGHHRHEAIEHFQKAIEIDPWNIPAYLHFGELYEQIQLPWRARPLYSKILEIDPKHAGANERLAQLDVREEKKSAPRIFANPFRAGRTS